MRLPLEEKLSAVQKVVLKGLRAFLGTAPGPCLVVSYRKDYFGDAWSRCMKKGMRQATRWSVGEVELFAAFVSKTNSCGY